MFGPLMWTTARTRPIGPGSGGPQPLPPEGGGVGVGAGVGAAVGAGVGAGVGAAVGTGVGPGDVGLGRGDGAGLDSGKNGIGMVRVGSVALVGSFSVIVWHPARKAVAASKPRRIFFMCRTFRLESTLESHTQLPSMSSFFRFRQAILYESPPPPGPRPPALPAAPGRPGAPRACARDDLYLPGGPGLPLPRGPA